MWSMVAPSLLFLGHLWRGSIVTDLSACGALVSPMLQVTACHVTAVSARIASMPIG